MDKDKDLSYKIIELFKSLEQKRNEGEFWQDRKDAVSYTGHRAYNSSFSAKKSGWDKKRLYDSTPVNALNQSLNGFMSYLISPSHRWFRFSVTRKINTGNDIWVESDNIAGLNDWAETCQQEILKLYHDTNFYEAMKLFIADGMTSGTACMRLIENDGDITFQVLDPFEFVIAQDWKGCVNIVLRVFRLTLAQSFEKWGNRLPDELLKLYKDKHIDRGEMFVFYEAVVPSGYFEKEEKREKETYDYYVVCDTGCKVVEKSRYDNGFPFAVLRWERTNLENPYGVGLAMKSLPEIRTLNKNMLLQTTANEKMINPAWVVPFSMRDFSSRPGSVNFGDTSQVPVTLKQVTNYEGFAEENQRLRNAIYENMLSTLFATLMRTQDITRTATEVNALKSEAMSLMGATLNNLQEEVIKPIILRTFRVMKSNNLLPPMPTQAKDIVSEKNMVITLDGVLVSRMNAYLQRQEIDTGLAYVVNMLQINPNTSVNIDWNELMRQGATAHGLPQSIIREKDDVEKEQKILQAQQAHEQELKNRESETRSMANMGNAGVNVGQIINTSNTRGRYL